MTAAATPSARRWAPRFSGLLLAFALAALPATAGAQTVRVVTEETPYSYLQDGRVAGAGVEVSERTLPRAGIADVRTGIYPWARAYAQARDEPHVLIMPLARTPERESAFQWVGELLRADYRLYALAGRPDVRAADLEAAKRLAIGVVRDDVRQRYLQQQGFARLVVSAEPGENFRKLLNRQVDALPLSDASAQLQCDQAGPQQCPGLVRLMTLDGLASGFYLAYGLRTPEPVVQRTRAAFEALRADGTVARLMGASGQPPKPVR